SCGGAGRRKTPYAPRSSSPGNSAMSIWGKLAGAAAELVRGGPTDSQLAFTMGVITLGAKIAKADGDVVTDDEVNAFKEVFKIPASEMGRIARVFNQAKRDPTGYESYAEQLAVMFKVTANYSRMCLKACSTSPRLTECCTRARWSFCAKSPSVFASPR